VINGATGPSYRLQTADGGNTVRVQVIASNPYGSATAITDHSVVVVAAAAPTATAAPTITGTAAVGNVLAGDPGSWNGTAPISYQYQWHLCDPAGTNCHAITGATRQTYQVQQGDLHGTIRLAVTASNSFGSTNATSGTTASVTPSTATGCPTVPAGQPVDVTTIGAPARLQITEFTPSVVIGAGMQSFSVRFLVTDTCGHPVRGASVYATAVPYNQVTIPPEQLTDGNGYTTMIFDRLTGFPASKNQELMALFVRATRPGDPLLAGISTRRLISVPVNLKQ
jgi:hypothetical protein